MLHIFSGEAYRATVINSLHGHILLFYSHLSAQANGQTIQLGNVGGSFNSVKRMMCLWLVGNVRTAVM